MYLSVKGAARVCDKTNDKKNPVQMFEIICDETKRTRRVRGDEHCVTTERARMMILFFLFR